MPPGTRPFCTIVAFLMITVAACQSDAPPQQAPAPAPPEALAIEATPEDPEPKTTSDPFAEPNTVITRRVREGVPVHRLLTRAGMSGRQAIELIKTLKPLINLGRKARPKDHFKVALNDEGDIVAFDYTSKHFGKFFVRRQGESLKASKGEPLPWSSDGAAETLPVHDLPETHAPGPGSSVVHDPVEEVVETAEPSKEPPKPTTVTKRPEPEPKPVKQQDKAPTAKAEAPEATKKSPKAPPKPTKKRERAWLKTTTAHDAPVEIAGEVPRLIRAFYATRSEKERSGIARKLDSKLGVDRLRKMLVRTYRYPKAKPGIQKYRLKTGRITTQYVVYVPDNYTSKRSYPLHISLHGGGGHGEGTCRRRWGSPPENFILVCPNAPTRNGHWWSSKGEETLLAVYRRVLRDYNINTDRVSLGGLSNGGTGTWHMATKYPWLWAAVVPRCAVSVPKEQWISNLKGLPAFMIHGTEDHNIRVSHSQIMTRELKKLGGKPRYIEVDGGGHDFFSQFNGEVIDWFLPKKRRKLPKSFTYTPARGAAPELIHWLAAEGTGTLKASMKSGASTVVRITTEHNPKTLRVFFPKGMADLRKPVRIVLNGKVVFTGKARASARDVLDSFGATGDLRRVFNGSVTLL